MTARPYTLLAPCVFHKPYQDILDAAADLGRNEGREDDWEPVGLQEALTEILLFGHSATDVGVTFLSSDTSRDLAWRTPIRLELEAHATRIRKHATAMLPGEWRWTLDNSLMVLLNSGLSPSEYDVMVNDRERAKLSNHERLAEEAAVRRFTVEPAVAHASNACSFGEYRTDPVSA